MRRLWCWSFLACPWAIAMAGPVPVHRGTLELTPCSIGVPASALGTLPAFCASLDVPERRAGGPSQRTIGVHVAVLPSTGMRAEPDPVLFLAGGPGQAATEAYPALAPGFDVWRRTRDIVLVDQRGTGRSHPLACPQALVADGSSVDDASPAAAIAAARARARDCLKALSSSADVAAYTTTETVADLFAVKRALGIEKWNILGVSYGTRVAQRFALAHPESTRSLILDSAVPADANLAADTGVNLDTALNARFSSCAATPACAEAFGSPAATLRRLRADLAAHPMPVDYRDPASDTPRQGKLTASRLEDTVRLAAYAPETAALLAHVLSRAATGDAAALMALGDMAEGELASLEGNVLQLSVLCTEDPPRGQAATAEKESLLGTRTRDLLAAQCEAWPVGEMPSDFHTPRSIAAPALVLQGEWDPATPPDYGRRVAQSLPRGQYLLAKGQGHNVVLRGCLPRLVADFLETPTQPLSTACLDRLAPLPDILDVQGASP